MRIDDLRRSVHAPSLGAALIHFDVSFMCWVLLGALGAYIAEDLALSPFEKGVVVAVPLLSAAVFRLALGLLGDRVGPKKVGTVSMAIVAAWTFVRPYSSCSRIGRKDVSPTKPPNVTA